MKPSKEIFPKFTGFRITGAMLGVFMTSGVGRGLLLGERNIHELQLNNAGQGAPRSKVDKDTVLLVRLARDK